MSQQPQETCGDLGMTAKQAEWEAGYLQPQETANVHIAAQKAADKILRGIEKATYNRDWIVGIINTAIAAEEQKRADWNVVIEDLEQQLAAERSRNKELQDEIERLKR